MTKLLNAVLSSPHTSMPWSMALNGSGSLALPPIRLTGLVLIRRLSLVSHLLRRDALSQRINGLANIAPSFLAIHY